MYNQLTIDYNLYVCCSLHDLANCGDFWLQYLTKCYRCTIPKKYNHITTMMNRLTIQKLRSFFHLQHAYVEANTKILFLL